VRIDCDLFRCPFCKKVSATYDLYDEVDEILEDYENFLDKKYAGYCNWVDQLPCDAGFLDSLDDLKNIETTLDFFIAKLMIEREQIFYRLLTNERLYDVVYLESDEGYEADFEDEAFDLEQT
jgi:hypothetical protein